MRRLNRLADVFPVLLERLCPEGPPSTNIGLTDSQPGVLAQQSRRFQAKVARQELANSGYCPAKKLYYHGVKIHLIGDYRPGTLPLPRSIGVTPAGMNDGPAVASVAPALAYRELYSDKAYQYGCFCPTPRKGKTSPSPCFVRCVRSYRKRKSRHGLVRNRSVSVMRRWGCTKVS